MDRVVLQPIASFDPWISNGVPVWTYGYCWGEYKRMVTVGVISPALRDRANHLRICIAHQENLASSYPEMITLIIPRSPLECSPNREEVLWGESSSTPEIKTDKILSFSNDHLRKNLIISTIFRNDRGEFLKIMSNQKNFPKNK